MYMSPPALQPWPAQPLEGRVILVTGGARGVGRGIAESILGAGGQVIIADQDVPTGQACLDEWGPQARRVQFVNLDVTDELALNDCIETAIVRFGQIDGLINNARNIPPEARPLAEVSWADWNRSLASLHAAFLCTRAALPHLQQSGRGAVVNIASTQAGQCAADTETYAAAQGGLLAFTRALAVSCGPEVRVNSISPGLIGDAGREVPAASPLPVGRMGEPRDIGLLSVFLLSELSGFISGQDFVADGGLGCRGLR